MSSRSSFLLFGAVLACSSSVALAAPDETNDVGLKIALKNGTGEKGEPKGSYFAAKGRCKPLIDGTRFVVTLSAVGRSRDFPVSVLRAEVRDNQYEVSVPWPNKVLAPLTYQVTVELLVSKQAKAVQQWIMNEYGYAQSHREIIDRKRVLLSTESERVAFAIENIEAIKGLVQQLEPVRKTVLAVADQPVGEIEGWDEKFLELNNGLVQFRGKVDRYFRQYVIILEQGFRSRIESLVRGLSRILRDHSRGRPRILQRLTSLRKDMDDTVELIKQYEPLPTQETLVPDEDEEGGNDEGDEHNRKKE